MRLGRMTSTQSLTRTYTNQTTSRLVHSWNTFGARTNHGQTQTHKIQHSPDFGEATTFPLIIYFVPGHGPASKWHFVRGLPNESPEIPKIGTPMTLGPHNFVYIPLIDMRSKAKL